MTLSLEMVLCKLAIANNKNTITSQKRMSRWTCTSPSKHLKDVTDPIQVGGK